MDEIRDRIAGNLSSIRGEIVAACERSGRDPGDVRLIAVTKAARVEWIKLLYDLGVRDMAESRPQSLWERAPLLPADISWRLIGHLQTNKVRRTLPLAASIDAIDRMALAEVVSAEAVRIGRKTPVLLEVKLTNEPTKHGFSAAELFENYDAVASLNGLEVRGLMGMAALDANDDDARASFRNLRELLAGLRESHAAAKQLHTLSMGMTRDYPIAIEEGATEVRIGSALWSGLE